MNELEIILNKEQLEAADEIKNFIKTLSVEEVKQLRIFIQGAKLTTTLFQNKNIEEVYTKK